MVVRTRVGLWTNFQNLKLHHTPPLGLQRLPSPRGACQRCTSSIFLSKPFSALIAPNDYDTSEQTQRERVERARGLSQWIRPSVDAPVLNVSGPALRIPYTIDDRYRSRIRRCLGSVVHDVDNESNLNIGTRRAARAWTGVPAARKWGWQVCHSELVVG